MKKIFSFWAILFAVFSIISCGNDDNDKPNPTPVEPTPTPEANFAKGADVSWLTQMESSGKKFYDKNGNETECLALLKSLGINSIRLRVWVNPAENWNGKADVIAKAKRAKNLGMKIMIDFHYSDTWADPAHQTKPAAWASLDFEDLKNAVSVHTKDVLNALKAENVSPDWVQVGNETNNGILWNDGKADVNMKNYADLNNAGYDAVKSVFPDAKVIVHISNGWNKDLFKWIFNGLKNNGGKWDVIGMSLYPEPNNWAQMNSDCLANISDLATLYGKEIMITEIGMSWDSAAACKSFISDLISKTKNNSKILGVFYWEPESYGNWQGYTKGAFDNSGKPTEAMDAFKD